MVGISPLKRLVNSRRRVTANARNVDQMVACSSRALSLTLIVGTSTAYPPLTGVIATLPQERAPQPHPTARWHRSPNRHIRALRWRSIRRWQPDRSEPPHRKDSTVRPSIRAGVLHHPPA